MHRYTVTVTNITRGQVLAPPAVIVHNEGYKLFDLGKPASQGLAKLAEEGDGSWLLSDAGASPFVMGTASGSGPIMPGASATIEITTSKKFSSVSVAAMLVTTNDGFMAVRDVQIPSSGGIIAEAEAYDAGSEANSESCKYIPGPPCGQHVHDMSAGEGYVHIHAGIHGIGDLTPSMHDWRGAVAQVEIKRID